MSFFFHGRGAKFYWVLKGLRGLHWVSTGITGFHSFSPGFIGFCRVLLGFTGFYWVLLNFIGFERELLDFLGFYRVIEGFTEFYRVKSSFDYSFFPDWITRCFNGFVTSPYLSNRAEKSFDCHCFSVRPFFLCVLGPKTTGG